MEKEFMVYLKADLHISGVIPIAAFNIQLHIKYTQIQFA